MAKTIAKPAATKTAPAKSNTPAKSTAPAKAGTKPVVKKKAEAEDEAPAKKKTKTGTKNPCAPGDIVVFDGYSQKVEEPLFAEGDYLRILEIKGPDKMTAERITLNDGEDEAPGDTVFVAEIHQPTDAEQAEIDGILEDAEDAATDSPYKGAKKKGKKKPAAEEEEEEEEAEEEAEEEETEDEAEEESEEESEEEEESEDEEEAEEEEEEAPKKQGKTSAPAKSTKTAPAKTTGKKGKAKDAEAEDEAEEEEEEEEAALEFNDSVKAAIEESGGDALEAVKSVKGRMNRDVVDMGILLTHIHANNIHASITVKGEGKKRVPKYDADKKGFASYVKDALDLEPRVAYGYMAVARLADTFGIDSETVAKIGWTKLQQLCDVANDGNIKALLKAAKEKSREDLVSHITETYADKGEGSGKRKKSGDKTKKLTLKFSVFGDQADLVKTAIATAKEKTGNDDDGQAIAYIIQEWAGLESGTEDDEGEESEEEGEEEEEAPAPKKKAVKKK